MPSGETQWLAQHQRSDLPIALFLGAVHKQLKYRSEHGNLRTNTLSQYDDNDFDDQQMRQYDDHTIIIFFSSPTRRPKQRRGAPPKCLVCAFSHDAPYDCRSRYQYVDAPRVDAPRVDTPRVDTPRVDTPRVDVKK